jgi:hypothetical protein
MTVERLPRISTRGPPMKTFEAKTTISAPAQTVFDTM